MEEIILEAQIRNEVGKSEVHSLRRQGFIPAVVYGAKKETKVIKIVARDLLNLLQRYKGENIIINLRIKEDMDSQSDEVKKKNRAKSDKDRTVLIKEIQYDPVKGDMLHVDFNQISLTEAITVRVPIIAKGEPIGVKQDGGVLDHLLWELEVECLPTRIPNNIELDVSNLKIGDTIHIKDIKLADDIKVLQDTGLIVFSVVPPIKEEVVVAPVGKVEMNDEGYSFLCCFFSKDVKYSLAINILYCYIRIFKGEISYPPS